MNGEKVIFLKPTTFMNNSGEAVSAVANYYDIALEDIVVVYDDMDMDPGRIRLRQKGSAGGHNGVKSMIAYLGTDKIRRIKLGIGHPGTSGTVVDHVLTRFSSSEKPAMQEAVAKAVEAIDFWLAGHTFEDTMTNFNN
ncbi:MAG: aminoacyl-tRNA hydrolase [Aerococcus viridans]|nr:MAG: aminoacyl-tRNA hydrolase [Aerococcus viridans]